MLAASRFAVGAFAFALASSSVVQASPPAGSSGAVTDRSATQPAKLSPAQESLLQAGVDAYEKGDMKRAARAFREGSAQGLRLARYNLAMMMIRGETPAASKQQPVSLLTQAAEQNFTQAQYTLGLLYEYGDRVPRSLNTANRWFERAANAGHSDAQISLATNHLMGRGFPADSAIALSWYEKAADGGDAAAQYIVARLYETGDGTAVDLDKALYWYVQAARNGEEAAGIKAKEITKMLSDRNSRL